jgi:hypothetical protein
MLGVLTSIGVHNAAERGLEVVGKGFHFQNIVRPKGSSMLEIHSFNLKLLL